MGMGDPVDRMRTLIVSLNEFYDRRFGQCHHVLGEIESAHPGEIDTAEPYIPYVQALNAGVSQVLAQHGVALDLTPPEQFNLAKSEVLLGGARMLKWTVTVRDATNGNYVGKFTWNVPHRLDRVSIPGPANCMFYKAAQGRTLMVG